MIAAALLRLQAELLAGAEQLNPLALLQELRDAVAAGRWEFAAAIALTLAVGVIRWKGEWVMGWHRWVDRFVTWTQTTRRGTLTLALLGSLGASAVKAYRTGDPRLGPLLGDALIVWLVAIGAHQVAKARKPETPSPAAPPP